MRSRLRWYMAPSAFRRGAGSGIAVGVWGDPFPTVISCCLEWPLFAFGCGVVEHHARTGSDGTVVCDRAT